MEGQYKFPVQKRKEFTVDDIEYIISYIKELSNRITLMEKRHARFHMIKISEDEVKELESDNKKKYYYICSRCGARMEMEESR